MMGLWHSTCMSFISKRKTAGLLFGQTKLMMLISLELESIAFSHSPVFNFDHFGRTVRLVVFIKEKNKVVAFSPAALLYQT